MDDEEDATAGLPGLTPEAAGGSSTERRKSRSEKKRAAGSSRPGYLFTHVVATSWSAHVKHLDPAEIKGLAARYGLKEAALAETLGEARRTWASDEQRRLDQWNSPLVDEAIKEAKRLHKAWERLSDGHKASVFAHRDDGVPDSGEFDRALAYLAEQVEIFLRLGPKVRVSKRIGPRDTVIRLLAAFWKDQKGKPVSAQGRDASSARFVVDAVKMITGKALPEHALREALEGKTEPKAAGQSLEGSG